MVVQRRDGPRWLRELDDDDDDVRHDKTVLSRRVGLGGVNWAFALNMLTDFKCCTRRRS